MSNDTITEGTVLDRFAQIVATSLRIDPSRVTEDAYLNELGADSLDLAEITLETEDEFNILIPQTNVLDTAREIVGTGVLVDEGRLTDVGKQLVRARLPEFALSEGDELTVTDLNRIFMRVGSWVRMIERLMEQTPRVCPVCGSVYGRQVAGRLKCSKCGNEQDIRSGDDLNREWVQEYCREALLLPPASSAS
jgi:acyl carrier protein